MKTNLKKKLIILTVFLVVLVVIFLIRNRNNQKIIIEPTPIPKIIYKNLELGMSTRNDVVREIGAPQNEYQKDNSIIVEYQTRNPNFNDQYVIIDNKLDFVKEIITLDNPIRISDLEKKYGNTNTILYGPGSGISLNLHVYIDQGVAFIGHKKSGYITEIWYFKPTDLDNFISRYATDYSKDNKPIQ